MRSAIILTAALTLLSACTTYSARPTVAAAGSLATPRPDQPLPRFTHVFVIVEENKSFAQVLDSANAPNLARLAHEYGSATAFYGEVHPSEANYVALLGGDTFGIHDDDAFYCKPRDVDRFCRGAAAPGYPGHTLSARHLGQQLEDKGLSWKGYYGDLPEPGSLSVVAGQLSAGGVAHPAALYASKHSGFLNFASVQSDPKRAERIVGFDQLGRDLDSDQLPNPTESESRDRVGWGFW